MTPRRKETNYQGQSVRFYKIVALSFLFLTIILLIGIVFMSSKRATITIVTKPEQVEINTTLDMDGGYFVTTTVASITEVFKPLSVREEVSIATGMVTIYNEKSYVQPLIPTTRLLSEEGIIFRLKDRVVVPANGSVEAEVYADEGGKDAEIGPTKFTIPGLKEDTQKYIYATSSDYMKGGVRTYGVVSEDDLKKAEDELVVKLGKLGKENLSSLFPDRYGVFAIVEYEVKSDVEIGVEIDEFELNCEAVVVGVFYDKEEILAIAKKELEKRIMSDTEKIVTDNTEPTVTLGDYSLEDNKAILNIFYTGLVELNPESKQLQKTMIFGKSKDETRRYLLSLDHVQGVDIKFNPAWMRTIPHVSEHVNIVVKNVE